MGIFLLKFFQENNYMKFSIITCTYNSIEYIEKNIFSVKNQNFNDYEHIFIDGFSTDGTYNILKKYQDQFPDNVKIFQFAPIGISNAMNKGIEKSSGEYLIHLHSDDSLFDHNVLKDVACFLDSNNNPDWIYGKINVLTSNIIKGVFPLKNIWQKKEKDVLKNYLLKFYIYIPHQSVFIKKEVFNKFGLFDERLKSAMDFDFWLRIRSKTRWFFYNRVISNFTLRADARSSGFKNIKENRDNILLVRERYLNKFEIFISVLLDVLLKFKSSNYQK